MGQLRSNNKNVVHEEDGNIVVINTCGFIDNAKQQSIDTILENVKKKNEGLIDKVFVTGCLSERYKPDLKKTQFSFRNGHTGGNNVTRQTVHFTPEPASLKCPAIYKEESTSASHMPRGRWPQGRPLQKGHSEAENLMESNHLEPYNSHKVNVANKANVVLEVIVTREDSEQKVVLPVALLAVVLCRRRGGRG